MVVIIGWRNTFNLNGSSGISICKVDGNYCKLISEKKVGNDIFLKLNGCIISNTKFEIVLECIEIWLHPKCLMNIIVYFILRWFGAINHRLSDVLCQQKYILFKATNKSIKCRTTIFEWTQKINSIIDKVYA